MFIKNATYKSIPTEGLSFPLAEGAIISGGIVPETAALAPPTGRVYIAVGGTIDLTSEANKNVSFTNEQIRALGGDFNFVPAEEAKSALPAVSVADNGDVLTVVNGAWSKSDPPSSLPSYTTSDNGKVLTVDGTGTTAALEWAAGGGGAGGNVYFLEEDGNTFIFHDDGGNSVKYEDLLNGKSSAFFDVIVDSEIPAVGSVVVYGTDCYFCIYAWYCVTSAVPPFAECMVCKADALSTSATIENITVTTAHFDVTII